jgi:hypothetical protein
MAFVRRCATLLTALCLVAGLVATSSCATKPKPTVEAPRPKPRNAAELARAIVGAKVVTLAYVDRVRGHRLAEKIAALDDVRGALEGTGLDPIRDVDRACIASTGIHRDDRAVVVAQHKLTDAQLRSALDVLIARSSPPGAWIDVGVPAAKVTVRGHTRVVALVEPGFVAVVPEALAQEAKRFIGTGGFPDPKGQEATVSWVEDPSQTLRAEHAPNIPSTVRAARIETRLTPDGGADVLVEGQSTDDAQAASDAAALTAEVERATSIKISFVRVRLFKPVPFRAEGSLVKAEVHLTSDEIDMLFRFMPR